MITLTDIQEASPWLKDLAYTVPESSWAKRDFYYKIIDNLEHHLMLSILGLRRVGKSTIIKQVIAYLLTKVENKTRILYYNFTSKVENTPQAFLKELLDFYLDAVVKEPIYNVTSTCYIFLDEIQGVVDWEETLKRYYDLSNQKLKFIVTGSQSLVIKGKSSQALAGRIFEFYLPPLSFSEFLTLNNVVINEPYPVYKENLIQELFNNRVELERYYLSNKLNLTKWAKEYLFYGQFPETQRMQEQEQKNLYIKESVVEKIVQDLIIYYKVDKTREFEDLTNHLIKICANELEVNNIASEIGLTRETVTKYIDYLMQGYLFDLVYKYHRSGIRRGKMIKKVYNTSANLAVAVNSYNYTDLDLFPQVFGHIAENVVFNKLKELGGDIFIWKKGAKDVDFLFKQKNFLTPIEVKFGNRIEKKDLEGILYYLKTVQAFKAIVVTKDTFEIRSFQDTNLMFIPYSLFLTIKKDEI